MSKTVKDERQVEFDILFEALPDISLRDQRDALERPLVGLSKNVRKEPIEYKFGDLFVRILPNPAYGQPTIWDYDIVMYLLGQVNERYRRERDMKPEPAKKMVRNEGGGYERVPDYPWTNPAIAVSPLQILRGIRRIAEDKNASGTYLKELRAAIGRLQSCMIETNIWHGKKLKRFKRFSLIHDFEELDPGESSSGGMRFVLPDWMIKSIESRKGILAINPDYFELSGGIERFLYRIARKHAGRQRSGWAFKMETLRDKSGSPMDLADFAKSIRKAIKKGAIPEYTFTLYRNEQKEEMVKMVWNRGLRQDQDDFDELPLGNDTSQSDAPVIEGEWREVVDETNHTSHGDQKKSRSSQWLGG